MIKTEVLKIIQKSEHPICDDCIALNRNFTRIQVNKRCTQLARDTYITRITGKCMQCSKTKITNVLTEDGAEFLIQIEKKKDITELIESNDPIEFSINFKCQWFQIASGDKPYLFPAVFDKSNNSFYNIPAVYRWILINKNGDKTQNLYIGEATELAQRIYQYINPGPSQHTNIRINKLFHELIDKGFSVTIEQLKFDPFMIGQFMIKYDSLKNKYVRRLFENLLTSYYDLAKYNILNS